MLLGPDTTGCFKRVQIKGIHTKSVAVDEVRAGQSASFAVKVVAPGGSKEDRTLRKNHIRKGQVLVDPDLRPRAARGFAAEVFVLHHPTTIKKGYQPVVHARTVRQVAAVQDMNVELLRSGTRARVRFRFQHYPEYPAPASQRLGRGDAARRRAAETPPPPRPPRRDRVRGRRYLTVGTPIIFREGNTRGIGVIKRVIHDADELKPMKKKLADPAAAETPAAVVTPLGA